MTNLHRLLGVALAAAFTGPALAQDVDDVDAGARVLYKQKTEIIFEDLNVAGEIVKPQDVLVGEHKRALFNPLIRIRADFDPEMVQSVDEVK
jgi:hypothetical protein